VLLLLLLRFLRLLLLMMMKWELQVLPLMLPLRMVLVWQNSHFRGPLLLLSLLQQ